MHTATNYIYIIGVGGVGRAAEVRRPGAVGGRLAGRVPPVVLRRVVVTVGVIVALIYLIR